MTYTARFAHLDKAPLLQVGDKVLRSQLIGVMGSSGQSTAAHLHFDIVSGEQSGIYSLVDIESGDPAPAPLRQSLFFVDSELFNIKPVVTTHYADPEYFAARGKVHCGYDLVPMDRHATQEHFKIYWPRSMPGRIVRVAYDPDGYGHHIQIAFEV